MLCRIRTSQVSIFVLFTLSRLCVFAGLKKRAMPLHTGMLGVLTAALALTGCHASEIPPLALTLANK
jgi:hypothetical protein